MSLRRLTMRLALVGRFAVSATLLLVVARALDVDEVITRLAQLSGPWVALGLGITVVQVVALAWRWRFTASRLGIDLPMRRAVSEYYISILLNQLLPGGVSGDISRAWRHARTPAPTGPAVRAVILERASGQVIMTTAAVVSLLALPLASGLVRLSTAGIALVAVALLVAMGLRRLSPASLAGRFWADTREALLARKAFPVQLASGVLVVGSYIALYLVAARAVGVDTPLVRLLPLVAPVLMTMLIPITVAGWGVREAAAASLWGLVGLTPEDGVSISVAYGLFVLVSSAPGVPILTRVLLEGRGRRGRLVPSESDDREAAAPRRGSRSGRG